MSTHGRMLLAVAVVTLGTGLFAQQDTTPGRTVAGTWDVSMMSHQLALVLEQEDTKVTGVMMVMGKDIAVDGEFTDGTLTLGGENVFTRPEPAGAPAPARMTLTAVMLDDGTLDGEMARPSGAVKWTAERLRKRK